jgi:hypothetical protein
MLKSANAGDLRVEQATKFDLVVNLNTAKEMSAIGTKRTCTSALHMSAIEGKADMTYCAANVCL